MLTMRPLLLLTILAAACGTEPGASDDQVDAAARGLTRVVPCTSEYNTETRGADGGRSVETDVRAELATDLAPTDGWRVSAVACDYVDSAPLFGCRENQTCDERPASKCVTTAAHITEDGVVFALCGNRVESRNAQGTLLGITTRKYLSVAFHIAPAE